MKKKSPQHHNPKVFSDVYIDADIDVHVDVDTHIFAAAALLV